MNELGDSVQRIVVKEVLETAHSTVSAGHFGRNKTRTRIAKYFTWPELHKDVLDSCNTCPKCQKAGTHPIVKAPLKPLPCAGVPFQKVALDIVGPLPRTKHENKYLFTTMCYRTNFPEAIPLKRVETKAVVDAMCEVFFVMGCPSPY